MDVQVSVGAVEPPSQECLLWEGVLGREGLAVTGRGELSVLGTLLLVFQRVLFIRLRERDGFKISLIALWAALVNRIQLLRPGRSSPNFSFWVKWTSIAFHCFTA